MFICKRYRRFEKSEYFLSLGSSAPNRETAWVWTNVGSYLPINTIHYSSRLESSKVQYIMGQYVSREGTIKKNEPLASSRAETGSQADLT